MTEYKCGNCKEIHVLSPKARFCPDCGSTSLSFVIKELNEPAQKESLGVYSPPEVVFAVSSSPVGPVSEPDITVSEVEQPRRRKK